MLGAALALAACKNAPSEEQCKSLLDHMVELEFKKAGANQSDQIKAEMAKQRKAVSDQRQQEFMSACTDKTSKARVECALAANDLDKSLTACDDIK